MTIELLEPKKAVDKTAVEILDKLLNQAINGDIHGLAIAGTTSDGSTFNVMCEPNMVMSMLGEIRILERDFIDLYVQTRIDPETGESNV